MKQPQIPILFEEKELKGDWLPNLMKQIEIIQANPAYEIKERAIETVFHIIGKAITKVGFEPSWRMLLTHFLSAFVECTPVFLVKPIKSNLDQEDRHGQLIEQSRESEEPSSKPSDSLSNCSQYTLFKKSNESLPKTYPQELAFYVRESQQTGPRVAKALRQMYQKGLERDETNLPEKCKEVTLRYLKYVKFKQRHFVLTDVNQFLKEMNQVIKQKEVDREHDLSHLESLT